MENPNAVYGTNLSRYDIDYQQYMNFEKSFGEFSKDYETYTVTDRNTPRQWFNFMVNDNYACVAANNGAGLSAYKTFDARLTKYSNTPGDYLLRDLNGRRKIIIKNLSTDKEYDLLAECKNLQFTVKPGEVTYSGNIDSVEFSVNIFVPNEKTCEFWIIELKNGNNKDYELKVGQDIALAYQEPFKNVIFPKCEITVENGAYFAVCEKFLKRNSFSAVFSMQGGEVSYTDVTEEGRNGKEYPHSEVFIKKKVSLESTHKSYVLFGAADTLTEVKKLKDCFTDTKNIDIEKGGYKPTVALVGGLKYTNNQNKITEWDAPKWDKLNKYVALNVSMNLFNGMQTKEAVVQAKSNLRSTQIQKETLEKSIRLEIETDAKALTTAEEQLVILKNNIDLAQRIYDMTEAAYKNGSETQLNLIAAGLSLHQAKLNYIKGVQNWNTAYDAMLTVTGEY